MASGGRIVTPAQRILARQALGLGIAWDRSTRNDFCTSRGSAEADQWRAMVAAGEAREEERPGPFARFVLTRAGAELALDSGDTLDPKHFPPIGQD